MVLRMHIHCVCEHMYSGSAHTIYQLYNTLSNVFHMHMHLSNAVEIQFAHTYPKSRGGGSNIFMCAPRHSGEYFVTVFISLYSGTYGVLCELNMHRMYVRHISLYVYQ
jgi:hypothetical protein